VSAVAQGYLASVHTTPEKFENGVLALKTHQMFCDHTTAVFTKVVSQNPSIRHNAD